MDIFNRIKEHPGPLGRYAEKAEGYFIFPELEGELNSRMMFNGEEVVCWSINNYLGLANHPEVRITDTEATRQWGMAYPMGARMMSGETKYHKQLEYQLAQFVEKEAAYVVNFGYQGIMSAIDSLLTRRDVVVYDSESHACIIDALRMHMGKRFAFDHNDIDSLEKHLKRAAPLAESNGGGILVITEGVFGMRGDQGRLKEIAALKERYKFRLLVDDAHGFGVLGNTGAGAGEEQGVQKDIDVYFSTFAKSMASIGAFLAGDKYIIDYLKYNMRSQMFAKSLPLPIVIGNLKRLELLRSTPQLRTDLWNNVNKLQDGLKQRGFHIGNTNSCVTPVYLKGSVNEATQLVHDLRENYKIFCSIVVYPVVPKDVIMLRLIPTAVHSDEDIRLTLDAFSAVVSKLHSGAYQTEFAAV
jgi:glycine C-acetyltransferase